MNRENIIAHRGWWKTSDEKNSFVALMRALEGGFGVETDFRDSNGRVIISHDPPEGDELSAKRFFALYSKLGVSSRIAINIKSDGLHKYLLELVSRYHIPQSNMFVFDMSVPDGMQYLNYKIPVYIRLSEYEADVSLLKQAAGVWLDNFTGKYFQVEMAQKLLQAGHRTCIVSAELHGRKHMSLWNEIATAGIYKDPLFELCTDFPLEAYEFFATNRS